MKESSEENWKKIITEFKVHKIQVHKKVCCFYSTQKTK